MMEEFVKSLGVIPLTVRYVQRWACNCCCLTSDGGEESHRIIWQTYAKH